MTNAMFIAAWLLFGAFTAATRFHFQRNPFARGMKCISLMSMLYVLALSWTFFTRAHFSGVPWVGLGCMIASALLFAWSLVSTREARLPLAFEPASPLILVTTGPFSYVRNPFYVSYILGWSGSLIVFPSPLLAVLMSGLIILYRCAVRQEETELLAKFGNPYSKYQSRVGRFWPMVA